METYGEDEFYAYVTFKDSADAWEVLKMEEYFCDCLDTHILPADTWKQPDFCPQPIEFIAEDVKITLNRLNDDVLAEIFGHLDAMTLINLSLVCSRFDVVMRQMVRPKQISIDLAKGNVEFGWKVIAAEFFGRTERVKLCADINNEPTPYWVRFCDIFCWNLNESLVELELVGVRISSRMLEQLESMLEDLKMFKWTFNRRGEDHGEPELVDYCPKLRELHYRANTDFSINTKSWQSLESVVLHVPLQKQEHFPAFFSNNAQLKRVEISCALPLIEHICATVPNLESLVIFSNERTIKSVWHPLRFVNIKEFSVDVVDIARESMRAFIQAAPQLTTFKIRNRRFRLGDALRGEIVSVRRQQAIEAADKLPPLKLFIKSSKLLLKVDDILQIEPFR